MNLWDVRRVHAPIHSLLAHAADCPPPSGPLQFYNLQFAPFSQDIVTASDADRRAYIWDLSRIGAAADLPAAGGDGSGDEEADNAPPELLFVHGGHTDKIADISWNPNAGEEWMAASVADDNILQIWQGQQTVQSAANTALRTALPIPLRFSSAHSLLTALCFFPLAHVVSATSVAESVYEDGDVDDAAGSAPNQPLQLD